MYLSFGEYMDPTVSTIFVRGRGWKDIGSIGGVCMSGVRKGVGKVMLGRGFWSQNLLLYFDRPIGVRRCRCRKRTIREKSYALWYCWLEEAALFGVGLAMCWQNLTQVEESGEGACRT